MRLNYQSRLVLIAGVSSCALLLSQSAGAQEGRPLPAVVEFNRDIRPILSDNCFACHGPDKGQRKKDFRLDSEQDAFADRGGYRALVPGKPEESELYLRVSAEDESQRMPPRKFGKKLSDRQVGLLRRWIEQGAKWQKHWSLIPPKRPAVLVPTQGKSNDPDAPVNAIDDFIRARLQEEGLRPSPEADRRTLIRRLSFDLLGLPPSPDEVDAYLGDPSPQAYERLVERLLASPHFGERLALYWLDLVRYADTGGYHSDNHRDVFLYRDYVIQAFNGNKGFDQFMIEQLAGDLLPPPSPPSEGREIRGVEQKIASGYNRLLMTTEEGGAQPKEYLAKYAADRVRNVSSVWLGMTMGCAECHDHKFDPFGTKEFYRFAAFFADLKEKAVGRQDQDLLPGGAQAEQLEQLDQEIAPLQRLVNTQTPELDAAQAEWEESAREQGSKGLPRNIAEIIGLEPGKRNEKQQQTLATYYRGTAPLLADSRRRLAVLQGRKAEIIKKVPTTLVATSVSPRVMRVLPRGNWLDDSGEIVTPGVPASLSPLRVSDRPATRLDLARWLLDAENPLTARVFVNRLWKLFFGQGIVSTLEDFGSQGAWPTHPDLLDWLAVEFRAGGWDVKHMIRLMVLSRTYRQSSSTPSVADPYNKQLARQARFRLDAELVRDNALAISGLLSRKVGGRSVKPYQPAGYWAYLNFPTREWQNDSAEELHRRGLYTYWCRTFLHPSLLAFDASTREECAVDRPRSNTPLQALVLLNDPTYVEAARVFAERILREGGHDLEERLLYAYRQALCRPPQPEEVRMLTSLVNSHRRQYQDDSAAAAAILNVGDRPAPADLERSELAAWTSVARALLNLHETITRN